MEKLLLLIILFSLAIFACSIKPINDQKNLTKAQQILNNSITAHGGKAYDNAHYKFEFRNKQYSFKNIKKSYTYQVDKIADDGSVIKDILENGTITRKINDQKQDLTIKEANAISGGLNSVIYFATLPHKLNDKAANVAYIGQKKVKNVLYEVIEVTFDKEGGGKDYDDEFYYWINNETNLIDYLAYNYQVGTGGVRFRSAYNKRNIAGITFQDYINYKAPLGTPLSELPSLYERDKLIELSRIETENITKI